MNGDHSFSFFFNFQFSCSFWSIKGWLFWGFFTSFYYYRSRWKQGYGEAFLDHIVFYSNDNGDVRKKKGTRRKHGISFAIWIVHRKWNSLFSSLFLLFTIILFRKSCVIDIFWTLQAEQFGFVPYFIKCLDTWPQRQDSQVVYFIMCFKSFGKWAWAIWGFLVAVGCKLQKHSSCRWRCKSVSTWAIGGMFSLPFGIQLISLLSFFFSHQYDLLSPTWVLKLLHKREKEITQVSRCAIFNNPKNKSIWKTLGLLVLKVKKPTWTDFRSIQIKIFRN